MRFRLILSLALPFLLLLTVPTWGQDDDNSGSSAGSVGGASGDSGNSSASSGDANTSASTGDTNSSANAGDTNSSASTANTGDTNSIPKPDIHYDKPSEAPPITGPGPAGPVGQPMPSLETNIGGVKVAPGLTPGDQNPSHYGIPDKNGNITGGAVNVTIPTSAGSK
jgi:hypothetical protein